MLNSAEFESVVSRGGHGLVDSTDTLGFGEDGFFRSPNITEFQNFTKTGAYVSRLISGPSSCSLRESSLRGRFPPKPVMV